MLEIDINSDMGERPEALRDGSEEGLMRYITSANIACGVHAGDDSIMEAVIDLARTYGVGVGAHPSFPDRENFGRAEMNLSPDEIERCVYEQVVHLSKIATKRKTELVHVKPHGALYNMAVKDSRIAEAIALGVRKHSKLLILFGLAGSKMLDTWRGLEMRVAGEAFADRAYEADGSLRSRKYSDSLITDPDEAARRVILMATGGRVVAIDGTVLSLHADTICIHSDTPDSVRIAATVNNRLHQSNVEPSPISKTLRG